ncbi:ribonuclease T2 [Aspergillus sclerotialis]|uniref:ribonuclease T2 n=1 Tax=Aspergillus sclerotialis TaxID=2070753 RepID=A0A3A2ZCY6_9EURO|nr:ribonuclease T2 [Aspergillus sclerotialis]
MPSKQSTLFAVMYPITLAVASTLPSCPSDIPLSCHNSTAVSNSCCFNSPGGSLLQTQFWDTDPATGPDDSWTIHGLWPDNCDGSYEQFCDKSREYSNITKILKSQDRSDLLDYMSEYWKDINGDDETFWEHEWNKHGTCINTIEPDCYENYEPQIEVGEFFEKVVDLFKGLDTYQALADAGIIPDSSETYTFDEIQSALKKMHGQEVTIICDGDKLNQVYYYYNVKGNAIDGDYKASAAREFSLSDSADGIRR